MQDTLSLTVIDTEVESTVVTGIGNFSPYIDLSAMVSGDEVLIRQYMDVAGVGDRKIMNTTTVTYADLQSSGDQAAFGVPFGLESLQTASLGLTLTAGTTPLSVPVRITNLGTGA